MAKSVHCGPAARVNAPLADRCVPSTVEGRIIAASGSGKTTSVLEYGAHLGLTDGDTAVKRALGWPVDPTAMSGSLFQHGTRETTLAQAGLAHFLNSLVIRAFCTAGKTIGLFNGALIHGPDQVLAAVDVPLAEYLQRQLSWREYRLTHYPKEMADDPRQWHNKSLDHFERNRASVRKMTDPRMVFRDFITAARVVRFAMCLRELASVQPVLDAMKWGDAEKIYLHARRLFLWTPTLFMKGLEDLPPGEDPELWISACYQRHEFGPEVGDYVFRGFSKRRGVEIFRSEVLSTYAVRLYTFLRALKSLLDAEEEGEAWPLDEMANLLVVGPLVLSESDITLPEFAQKKRVVQPEVGESESKSS